MVDLIKAMGDTGDCGQPFIETGERLVTVLDNSYDLNYQPAQAQKYGSAVLSDRRLYEKGACHPDKLYPKHREERIIELHEVIESCIKKRLQWPYILLAALCIAAGLFFVSSGLQYSAAYGIGSFTAGVLVWVLFCFLPPHFLEIVLTNDKLVIAVNPLKVEEYTAFQRCLHQEIAKFRNKGGIL